MKKAVILLVLFVAFMGCVFADYDLDSLSAQQRQKFLMNSLSVEVGSSTRGSMFSGTNVYGGTAFTTGTISSSTSTVWTPYMGGNPISKSDFFKIAGDEINYAVVQEYEKERARNRTMMWTFYGIGFPIAIVGLIIECTPLFTNDYSDEAMRKLWLGTGIALGGCAIACIGIPFELKSKQDVNISAQYAVGVADAYNYDLYQKISLGINY